MIQLSFTDRGTGNSGNTGHLLTGASEVMWGQVRSNFNPIRGGGGGLPPSGFSCVIAKRRKIESSYLVTFSKLSMRTFRQKKLLGQVRSGHQRRFVDPTSEKFVIALSFSRINFLSSGFNKGTTMHNLYISEFVYPWPEVRSDSWTLHYKPMRKYWNAPCFE